MWGGLKYSSFYTGFPGSVQRSFSKCWPTVWTVAMVSSLLLRQWTLFSFLVITARLQAANPFLLWSSLLSESIRSAQDQHSLIPNLSHMDDWSGPLFNTLDTPLASFSNVQHHSTSFIFCACTNRYKSLLENYTTLWLMSGWV